MLMNQHISMVVIMVTWRADAISDRTVEESTRPRLGQLDITKQVAKIKKPTTPLHQTAVFGFRHPACSIQKILQRR